MKREFLDFTDAKGATVGVPQRRIAGVRVIPGDPDHSMLILRDPSGTLKVQGAPENTLSGLNHLLGD